MAKISLQAAAKQVQGVHIETDVHDGSMQQHWGEQPPNLPESDQFVDLHPIQRWEIFSQEGLRDHLDQENADGDPHNRKCHNWIGIGQFNGDPFSSHVPNNIRISLKFRGRHL